MSDSSSQNYVSDLIQGLEKRSIDFVVSQDALGCQISEVYLTESQELLLFPYKKIDESTLRWILEVRTPLTVRLTFFTRQVAKFRIQLMRVVSKLKQDGLEIPNVAQSISVQELSKANIERFLDSLDTWSDLQTNGSPITRLKTNLSSIPTANQVENFVKGKSKDLYIHLMNAIKTYWTERYFARYLNTPIVNVKKIAKRIGIPSEVCGRETLYFFDRTKALCTYFVHILKGILGELNMPYQETSKNEFYLPDLRLILNFFDGTKEQLKILAVEYPNKQNLVIVMPESLQKNIEHEQDAFFKILPLNQEKIKRFLLRIVRRRIQFIPAYSSGLST